MSVVVTLYARSHELGRKTHQSTSTAAAASHLALHEQLQGRLSSTLDGVLLGSIWVDITLG